MAWPVRRGGNHTQTPIVVGDLLFACRDNGLLTCFKAAAGRELYRHRLEGTGFTAPPVAAGGRLYFAGEDGRAHVVRVGPDFELLAEDDLGGRCLATPAVSGGTVFFRTQGHLLAVGGERRPRALANPGPTLPGSIGSRPWGGWAGAELTRRGSRCPPGAGRRRTRARPGRCGG